MDAMTNRVLRAHSSSLSTVASTKGFRSPLVEVGVLTNRSLTEPSISAPRSFRTVMYCRNGKESIYVGNAEFKISPNIKY